MNGRTTGTSRRPAVRAVALGAGLGGWLGTLAGLVPGLLPGRPLTVLILGGLLVGAGAGAVIGLLVHLATGSRREAAGGAVRGEVRRHRQAGTVEWERTVLPGFGMSYTFDAAGGHRVGVLAHPSGRREVLFYDPEDPDRVRHAAALTEVEAVTVAQVLGMPVFADAGAAR